MLLSMWRERQLETPELLPELDVIYVVCLRQMLGFIAKMKFASKLSISRPIYSNYAPHPVYPLGSQTSSDMMGHTEGQRSTFVPILPNCDPFATKDTKTTEIDTSQEHALRRRIAVNVACERCRRQKTKV